MNIISCESESDMPEELRCIFCNQIDKDQRQFIDLSFMYCPTCYNQYLSKYEFDITILTHLMQMKCKFCGKFRQKIDLKWHEQKCIQFQQSNSMIYYEQINKNDKTILICRNQFCNQEISFDDAHNHQLKCEWRILDCPYKHQCQWRGTKRCFKLHSQKCQKQESQIEKQIFQVQQASNQTFFDALICQKQFQQLKRDINNINQKLAYFEKESKYM